MDLAKIARPGTRVEIRTYESEEGGGQAPKYYASKISDVPGNNELELYMPTDQGKMLLLSEGERFDIYFYSKRGMYQINARVKERYKDGGLFLLRASLSGELRRNQRREHYRYTCSISMLGRVMDGAERKWLIERGEMVIMEGEPMETNTIADISGGGIKFSSGHRFAPETLLYCEIEFGRLYKLCCIVLDVAESETEKDLFIHRAQFYGMDNADREELIKYIFDLELKQRREALEQE